MKPKHRRLAMIVVLMMSASTAAALILSAFQDNLVFFYSPSDMLGRHIQAGQRFRLGGLVAPGSIRYDTDGITIHFIITDLRENVPVVYNRILPDLFRENQGVVAEGTLDKRGVFTASEVLARHDEKYMPPEVAKALKASGEWRADTKTSKP